MERENIRIISLTDPDYPALLKEITNPPYLLYAKGKFDFNSSIMVALVGARECTPYGSQAALALGKDLARSGVTVVSGMAFGIDSSAHRGAIGGRGKTVAVLGNSLDEMNIYPRSNLKLSREISENGALLSEYPIETPAGLLTFPARNRIIAGLALGTVVIEAGERSGSLITAEMALEYNREVFAVPGPIFSPKSEGANNLIRKGAKIVTGVKDILEELNLEKETLESKKIIPKIPGSPEEEKILKQLSSEPIHIDNISKLTKLGIAAISSALSIMEIKGWVKNIGGQNYIIL
jgi:DNA processing protein